MQYRIRKAVSAVAAASLLSTSLPLGALAGGGSSGAPQGHMQGNAADIDLRSVATFIGGGGKRTATVEPITRADYEACQAADEEGFRAAIQRITSKSLTNALATVDYKVLVTDEWRRETLDAVIDKRVDAAVAEVRDETSWGGLISSLASKEKAQELATAVAERVYRSEPVKVGIEGLATGVAKEIGKRLELASSDTSEPALTCLKSFLGPRYGTTVARMVTTSAEGGFAAGADRGSADISTGDIVKQSSGGITGVAVVLMRRQLGNIAGRIGQRLVGSVLSRLVSVVAGGIGLVLIAKDIWDLRHGVLPIIADEMKAPATKDKVREELAQSLAEVINDHVKEIAAKSADQVVEVWRDFRRAHAMVLDAAERNDRFRGYLDTLSAPELPRLDEVTSLVVAKEGQDGLVRRLDDGTLDESVRRMPASAMEIARATRSLETALRWASLAGGDIDAVVANDLFRRIDVDGITSGGIKRLLSMDDRLAMTRLASVSRNARDVLFELPTADLKELARNLSEKELETLAGYLTGLAPEPRDRVLRALAAEPAKMKLLASDAVRQAVVASRDQSAAVEIMLRPQGVLDPAAAIADIERAWKGDVHSRLIWEKHPVAFGVMAFGALLVLLLLLRLLRPRRIRHERPETPGTDNRGMDGANGRPAGGQSARSA